MQGMDGDMVMVVAAAVVMSNAFICVLPTRFVMLHRDRETSCRNKMRVVPGVDGLRTVYSSIGNRYTHEADGLPGQHGRGYAHGIRRSRG